MRNAVFFTSQVFGSLSNRRNVYTVNDLLDDNTLSQIKEQISTGDIIFGQVFSPAEIDVFKARLPLIRDDSETLLKRLESAEGKLVHKKKCKNSLISEIQTNGEDYTCQLVIPDGNDMVADHVTGEHISGMVLAEAARQMSMAVIDSRFDDDKKRYQVVNRMDVNFSTFIHPFDTTMHMHFYEFLPQGEKCQIDCEIDFVQANEIKTSVRLQGIAATMSFARKLEDISVSRYLKAIRKNTELANAVEVVA